jgi:hypothetical protein
MEITNVRIDYAGLQKSKHLLSGVSSDVCLRFLVVVPSEASTRVTPKSELAFGAEMKRRSVGGATGAFPMPRPACDVIDVVAESRIVYKQCYTKGSVATTKFRFTRADHTERRTGQLCRMSKVCDHRSPCVTALLIEIRLKIKCDKKIPCQSCQVTMLSVSQNYVVANGMFDCSLERVRVFQVVSRMVIR